MANKKLNQLVTKPSIASGDLFPIADATTGQLYKTTISDLGTAIGSGVSSVNGLVGAVVLDTDDIQELASPVNKWFTDLRARAAISVSSPLAYNSGTGLITIAQATGSANGYLSSTDWTTFNSKQAALSGTGFVKISGTTISYDNSTYLTTSAAATNYVPYTGATANVNLGLNYSLTAALIIKSGGTSTQFLKADGSIDTNTYLTTGSAASTYLPLSGGTISGDLTISSTNPRIYLTDTDNNPDYFISNTDGTFTIYDVTAATSRFTIGTTGNGVMSGSFTAGSHIVPGGTSSQFLKANGTLDSTAYLPLAGGTLTGALFATSASFSGFVGFGGNTSPLAAIDVTGAGRFSSSVTASSHIVSGGTSSQFQKGDGSLDSNTYLTTTSASSTYLAKSGGTLTGALSGTSATFSGAINLTGSANSFQVASIFRNANRVFFGGDTGGYFFQNSGNTATVLQIADSGAATFSSSVTAAGNYQTTATSSANFFQATNTAGDIYVGNNNSTGSTFPTSAYATVLWSTGGRDLVVATNNSERMRITSAGNVGIGTTSPTSLLDVKSSTPAISINSTNTSNASTLLFKYSDSYVAEINAVAGSGQMSFNVGPSAGWGGYMSFKTDTSERMRIKSNGIINFSNVPTSSSGLSSGDVYKTVAGVLMIV